MFLTDETSKKRIAQIDLKSFGKLDSEGINDLIDVLIYESRKGEKSMPWEDVKAELYR